MSGRKATKIEDERRSREEAMRREAERREAEALSSARAALDSNLRAWSDQADALRRLGVAELADSVSKWIVELSTRAAKQHASHEVAALAAEAGTRAGHARDARAALAAYEHDSLRQAAEKALTGAASSAELGKKAAAWLDSITQAGSLAGTLRRILRLTKLAATCRAAGIPLSADIEGAAAVLGECVADPSPDRIRSMRDRLGEVRAGELEVKLEVRRKALATAAAALTNDEWKTRMSEWRVGLASDVEAALEAANHRRWQEAAPTLSELDDFLAARARHRIEVLRRGAGLCEMTVTETVWDEALGAYSAEIRDAEGQFGMIREKPFRWFDLAGSEDELEVFGPRGWDGEACMDGGIGTILDRLRAQGVRVEMHVGELEEEEEEPHGYRGTKATKGEEVDA